MLARRPPWEKPDREKTFVSISGERMCEFFDIYDHDEVIQEAVHTATTGILGGGFTVKRRGFTRHQVADAADSTLWCAFIRRMLRSVWSVGFALCLMEPDPIQKRPVPRVLAVERLDLKFHCTISGKGIFIARMAQQEAGETMTLSTDDLMSGLDPRLAHSLDGGKLGELIQRYPASSLPGIGAPCEAYLICTNEKKSKKKPIVIPILAVVDTMPTPSTGRLHSRIARLQHEYVYRNFLLHCSMQAESIRCRLNVVTEQVPEPPQSESKMDPALVQAPTTDPRRYHVTLARGAARRYTDALNRSNDQTWDQLTDFSEPRGTNLIQAEQADGGAVAPDFEDAAYRCLPPHTKLARPVLPEPPAGLIQFYLFRSEHVFNAFGIPPAMMSDRRAGGRVGVNENCLIVFRNAQLALKRFILDATKTLYSHGYASIFQEQYIATRTPREIRLLDQLSASDLAAKYQTEADLTIYLPGIPSTQLMDHLFTTNMLTHRAYKEHIKTMYGLTASDLNMPDPRYWQAGGSDNRSSHPRPSPLHRGPSEQADDL